jgi:hypothetical protein
MESDSMDLAREITEFLRCAVPTLANYQRRKEEGTLPVPPEEVVAPDRENRFWKDFLEDQEDILTLKWFESQNAGRDIGFERALQFWLKDGDRWRTTPGGGEE